VKVGEGDSYLIEGEDYDVDYLSEMTEQADDVATLTMAHCSRWRSDRVARDSVDRKS
jgi:hypothetical protein